MKRHETWLVQKERELREKVRPILLSFFFYVSRKLNLNYTSEFCWHNFKIVVFSVNFEAETNDKSESKNKLTCNHFLNIFINLCEDIYFSFCLYVRNLIQANVLFYFIQTDTETAALPLVVLNFTTLISSSWKVRFHIFNSVLESSRR